MHCYFYFNHVKMHRFLYSVISGFKFIRKEKWSGICIF